MAFLTVQLADVPGGMTGSEYPGSTTGPQPFGGHIALVSAAGSHLDIVMGYGQVYYGSLLSCWWMHVWLDGTCLFGGGPQAFPMAVSIDDTDCCYYGPQVAAPTLAASAFMLPFNFVVASAAVTFTPWGGTGVTCTFTPVSLANDLSIVAGAAAAYSGSSLAGSQMAISGDLVLAPDAVVSSSGTPDTSASYTLASAGGVINFMDGGPRLVTAQCGVQALVRDRQVWTRSGPSGVWTSVRATASKRPLLLLGPIDTFVCLDQTPVASMDLGSTWPAGLGPMGIPSGAASWYAARVLDGMIAPDGRLFGVGIHSAADFAYNGVFSIDGTGAVTTGRESLPVGGQIIGMPFADFSANGVFASQMQEYGYVSLQRSNVACGRAGQRGVVGWSAAAGAVQVAPSTGISGGWPIYGAPATVAALAGPVDPYLVELPNGQWEAGWYDGSAWHKYLAASPAGPWSGS
jgi:hypothetical protein